MDDVSKDVPELWKQLGFSGKFSVESDLGDPDGPPLTPKQVDEFEAKLPARVPFGSRDSGWLALRLNREAGTVVLVRRDADAVTEAAVRPQGGKDHPW